MSKKPRQKFKYLGEEKRAFNKVNQKAFFIIFKGASVANYCFIEWTFSKEFVYTGFFFSVLYSSFAAKEEGEGAKL